MGREEYVLSPPVFSVAFRFCDETTAHHVYSLCAPVHSLQVSFDMAEYTANVDGIGTLRLLDALRTCGLEKSVRFYQASTR